MRITLLALHFAEYSYRLARALSDFGPVQLVIDTAKLDAEAPDAWRQMQGRDIEIMPYRASSRPLRLFSGARALREIRRFGPEFIIAHEQISPAAALLTAAATALAPVRLIVHDPAPHSGADAAHHSANQRYVALVRRLATSFIVHGSFCRAELARSVGFDKAIRSVAHGVLSPPRADQLAVPIVGRVLFFGRLELYKGLDTLFAAADILAERLPIFSLLIIGRGNEMDKVREMADSRTHVALEAGFASAERVVGAMQEASVVVLPYNDASQSGVLSIAFANARPVVATSVGSIRESVPPEAGLLVPPRNPEALAEALYTCLADRSTWDRLSNGAAKVARHDMSWAKIAREMSSVPIEKDRP